MKKYRLRIGLDVDDTLYICNEYALSLLRKTYGDLPELSLHRMHSWGRQGDRSDERFALFADPAFVRSQPLYEGAQAFVQALSQVADVFFVTSVPAPCMSARAERLLADFPEIPSEHIIIGTRKDLISLDILLDDGAHNISRSQASYPVLMRRPWNVHLSGLLSVHSYADFLHLVQMIQSSFVEKEPDLSRGGVICLVGPSGTGKTQIAEALCRDPRYQKPVTTTTRPRLAGEREDAYRFIDEETFLREKDAGRFIETTVYSRYFFGTSAAQITPTVDAGKIAVLPIDICGALTLKNLYRSRALLVFTDRDTEAILLDILKRPIDDADKARRILSLDFERRNAELCDFAVCIDDGIDLCLAKICRGGKG